MGSNGFHPRENLPFFSALSLLQEAESKSELSQNISAREHFVFTDNDGQVYHLTVEGNSVKDSARIPPDVSVILRTPLSGVCDQGSRLSIPSEDIVKPNTVNVTIQGEVTAD